MFIEKKAIYFGTTIEGERSLLIFPKRYKENNMFMRGNGNIKIDSDYIYFSYLGMSKKFSIPIKLITKVEIGKGHAGQYIFKKCVLKIYWKDDNQLLVSGFKLFSDLDYIKDQLNRMIK